MGLFGKISGAIHHAIDKGKDTVNDAVDKGKEAVDKTKKGTEEAVDKTKDVVKQGVKKLRTKKTYEDGLQKLAKSPATLSEKIDYMTKKLDDSTYGYGSLALAIAVPEVFVAKAVADAITGMQQGKPPIKILTIVATYVVINAILGREIQILKIPTAALGGAAVREKLMQTPAGKEVVKRIVKAIPSDYKKLFQIQVEEKNKIYKPAVVRLRNNDIRDVIHPLQVARVNPRFPIKS